MGFLDWGEYRQAQTTHITVWSHANLAEVAEFLETPVDTPMTRF